VFHELRRPEYRGVPSPEEIEFYRVAFDSFDTDSGGSIDSHELNALLKVSKHGICGGHCHVSLRQRSSASCYLHSAPQTDLLNALLSRRWAATPRRSGWR